MAVVPLDRSTEGLPVYPEEVKGAGASGKAVGRGCQESNTLPFFQERSCVLLADFSSAPFHSDPYGE